MSRTTRLRVVVLDTHAETAGSAGLLRQSEIDDFVIPTLDQAAAQGTWVYVDRRTGEVFLQGFWE